MLPLLYNHLLDDLRSDKSFTSSIHEGVNGDIITFYGKGKTDDSFSSIYKNKMRWQITLDASFKFPILELIRIYTFFDKPENNTIELKGISYGDIDASMFASLLEDRTGAFLKDVWHRQTIAPDYYF